MKFFSNEKENETQEISDRDRAATDPVGVPPQRAGSPWSDAPGDTPVAGDRPAARDSLASDDTSASGDTSTDADKPKTATTYGPDGTVVEDTVDDKDYRGSHADRDAVDLPLDQPKDDADRTQVISSDDRKRDDAVKDADTDADKDAAIKDDGTFDSPKAVDPATGDTLKDDSDTDKAATNGYRDGEEFQPTPAAETPSPVVAAAPVPASTTPAGKKAESEKLLPDGDSFAERFRDIQLRFVDEPKAATAEAAELVGEAVDKLTGALKAQRDSLGGNADDTEKLRVELRAYRDIINRLTAL
ncbi:hypothetical protein JIG36_24515 [Actinoplanes sp. LDG1-06]|uniref:Uncharacterized protein n=1 Tax=Paractinoplanes ovalisporus TaxID=2810368 RepID=A0ABS2AHN8_9ACTN|nr:hypothetical protein [Actinoplanes ovalisporus]MBM2618726.1 hypothetical protein [Actinoplanes ovalisporus]